MVPAWWRRWHRWVGFVAGLFLLFASTTGVIVAMTEFFGEEEARREATRALVSAVTTTSDASGAVDPLQRALAAAAARAPGAPIDTITLRFKGDPTVDVFLGRPEGGEDRRLVIDARTGAVIREDSYVDKPFIHRLHSGEAFGDGGLVIAMIWGAALAFLAASGLVIYFTMRRRNPSGMQRLFW
jgi:sulfite reductase (NADPH) flavoprotein alpha-component